MKTNLYFFLGAAALGFFAAGTLAQYQPFTFAYTKGAEMGTPAAAPAA